MTPSCPRAAPLTVSFRALCLAVLAGSLPIQAQTPAAPRVKTIRIENLGAGSIDETFVRAHTSMRAGEPLTVPEIREIRATHDLLIPHLLERRPESLANVPRPRA